MASRSTNRVLIVLIVTFLMGVVAGKRQDAASKLANTADAAFCRVSYADCPAKTPPNPSLRGAACSRRGNLGTPDSASATEPVLRCR